MKIIRSIDIFDRNVSLKYQNQSKFRTCCGAIVTIVIFVLMIVHLSVLIMNPSEKTTVSTTSNITTSDNTTDQVTTQVIGDTEFELLNDFRMYNNFKTLLNDTQLHNVTESGWFVSVVLSQPYNSSLHQLLFYTSERQDVDSDVVSGVLPATV